MRKTNCLFLLMFFIVANTTIYAQAVQVKNVSFHQEGGRIFVNYDLIGKPGKKYIVTLHGSDDYGKSYTLYPSALSGDAGKNITTGYGKQIIWRMTSDYPQGLEGEGFVFRVDAESLKEKSKWPWVVAAGVTVGIVYFVKNSKKNETDKGSIIIQMPDNY